MTSLRTALLNDLHNNLIILQLEALGLIGKFITGPWMRHLYGNSSITNLDVVPIVKMCLVSIKQFKEDPLLILKSSRDVFGCLVDSDAILQVLQINEMPEEDMFTLRNILETL